MTVQIQSFLEPQLGVPKSQVSNVPLVSKNKLEKL